MLLCIPNDVSAVSVSLKHYVKNEYYYFKQFLIPLTRSVVTVQSSLLVSLLKLMMLYRKDDNSFSAIA